MMKTRSLASVALHLLLHQTNGFVPAYRKSSSLLLSSESKNNLLENIFEKTRSKNEQQTEKLLMDPMADMNSSEEVYTSDSTVVSSWTYADFAKNYPNVNNIGIATIKTASADLLAQVAIAHTPITDIDWERAFLFCAFGAIYLGQ